MPHCSVPNTAQAPEPLDRSIIHWRSSHYACTHVRNKNNNIQGRSPNVVKVIFHATRNCSNRKEFAPIGSKFFPFREVPILKRDAIEVNHYLVQYSPFVVRNFFSVLATPLNRLQRSIYQPFSFSDGCSHTYWYSSEVCSHTTTAIWVSSPTPVL